MLPRMIPLFALSMLALSTAGARAARPGHDSAVLDVLAGRTPAGALAVDTGDAGLQEWFVPGHGVVMISDSIVLSPNYDDMTRRADGRRVYRFARQPPMFLLSREGRIVVSHYAEPHSWSDLIEAQEQGRIPVRPAAVAAPAEHVTSDEEFRRAMGPMLESDFIRTRDRIR